MEPIILASTSPRRQDILKSLGLPFSVLSPAYEEIDPPGMGPAEVAEYHAMKKVESIVRMQLTISVPWVLGADTLISLDGRVFGKSPDRDGAAETLRALSGRTHQVITSLALFDSERQWTSCKTSVSEVTFAELTPRQIEGYLDTGEWQGVAGSYRIQGVGACLVERITGSYSGIVGLPIRELYEILREHGYAFVM
ncbi:MAG TPA: Maf family protein [Treponemataceae bacterium]|jgi:septum formation protein|nr:Maf family protein [Treponemataceae bacterium]